MNYPSSQTKVIARPRRLPPALKPLLLGSGVALLFGFGFLLLALTGLYVYYQLGDVIVPGVQVGGRDLRGQTIEEAAVVIHSDWNLARQIRVADGLHEWTVTPAELGLWVDAVETARQAYAIGHRDGQVRRISQMWFAFRQGLPVVPVLNLNLEQTRSRLADFEAQARREPRDAALQWDGSQFVEIPPELGYTIDLDTALADFPQQAEQVLLSGFLKLPLKPLLPAVRDVAAVRAQAQALIANPPPLTVYDPISDETFSLPLTPQVVGNWLVVTPGVPGAGEPGAGDSEPVVALDAARVANFLQTQDAVLGSGRYFDPSQAEQVSQAVQAGQSPLLIARHYPTTYQVQPGDTLISVGWRVEMPFWMILQANPGMDPDNLIVGETITIPSKDDLLPFPVVLGKRVVINIGSQRLDIYENGQRLARHKISTGLDRSPTQPGVFQIQTHELNAYASVWDLYMPHFLGIYEAWPGFMNGIHGLPTLSNGRRLWADVLGRPASYGCIILDLAAAEWLYNWGVDGVVVEIRE